MTSSDPQSYIDTMTITFGISNPPDHYAITFYCLHNAIWTHTMRSMLLQVDSRRHLPYFVKIVYTTAMLAAASAKEHEFRDSNTAMHDDF